MARTHESDLNATAAIERFQTPSDSRIPGTRVQAASRAHRRHRPLIVATRPAQTSAPLVDGRSRPIQLSDRDATCRRVVRLTSHSPGLTRTAAPRAYSAACGALTSRSDERGRTAHFGDEWAKAPDLVRFKVRPCKGNHRRPRRTSRPITTVAVSVGSTTRELVGHADINDGVRVNQTGLPAWEFEAQRRMAHNEELTQASLVDNAPRGDCTQRTMGLPTVG